MPSSQWIVIINIYQKALSPYMLHTCRFLPTCSQYAKEAIERFGTLQGGWLTFRRLLRCHPFGPHGVDLVP